MKSSQIVIVDANIIRCHVHHQNNNQYSISLKLGKDSPQSTAYYPSGQKTIEINEHLHFKADKSNLETFPKFALSVNVITQNKQRRTIGTTFVNYKIPTTQFLKVSECSCKDKAFEIQMIFAFKIVDLKNSKNGQIKKQESPQKKSPYSSQQMTPKESRQKKTQKGIKQKFQQKNTRQRQITNNLKAVKSQKLMRSQVTQNQLHQNLKQSNLTSLQIVVQELQFENNKLKQELNEQIQRYCCLDIDLKKLKKDVWITEGLLSLEEQKYAQAQQYIKLLQLQLFNLQIIFNEQTKSSKAKPNLYQNRNQKQEAFKIIEEKDQIILINEELMTELQIQKNKNKELQKQIQFLSLEIKKNSQVQSANNLLTFSRKKSQLNNIIPQITKNQNWKELFEVAQARIIQLQMQKQKLLKSLQSIKLSQLNKKSPYKPPKILKKQDELKKNQAQKIVKQPSRNNVKIKSNQQKGDKLQRVQLQIGDKQTKKTSSTYSVISSQKISQKQIHSVEYTDKNCQEYFLDMINEPTQKMQKFQQIKF